MVQLITGQLERKIIRMTNHNIITLVKNKNPLIHHLTNQVVMNFTANGLLAFGGSPVMAKEPLEMEEMTGIADGLLINIGMLTESDLTSMLIAGIVANKRDIPVVLDPVGVAATDFRSKAVKKLLNEIQFTAIKGNAGEMAFLIDVPWQTKGVESIDNHTSELVTIADKIAKRFKTIAVITGETDVLSDGKQIKENKSGHIYLTKITGAGCVLGSLITASLASSNEPFKSIAETVHFYGKAAEYAINNSAVNGTGTFIPHFVDALSKNNLRETE